MSKDLICELRIHPEGSLYRAPEDQLTIRQPLGVLYFNVTKEGAGAMEYNPATKESVPVSFPQF